MLNAPNQVAIKRPASSTAPETKKATDGKGGGEDRKSSSTMKYNQKKEMIYLKKRVIKN